MTRERYLIYGEFPTLVETASLLAKQGEFFLCYEEPSASDGEWRASSEGDRSYHARTKPSLQNWEQLADRLVQSIKDISPDNAPTVIISTSFRSAIEQVEVLSSLMKGADNPLLIVTTATFTATEMAAYLQPEYGVIGFNGIPGWTSLPRIEVTHSWNCPEYLFERAQQLFTRLGFEVERVEDRVGLVMPRILAMLINEAAFAVMEKVADPADIDRAVKLGVNYPHGLLEWADYIGIDRVLRILDALYQEYGDPRYRACPLLRQYVRAGWKGKEVGRGFFEYSRNDC